MEEKSNNNILTFMILLKLSKYSYCIFHQACYPKVLLLHNYTYIQSEKIKCCVTWAI